MEAPSEGSPLLGAGARRRRAPAVAFACAAAAALGVAYTHATPAHATPSLRATTMSQPPMSWSNA